MVTFSSEYSSLLVCFSDISMTFDDISEKEKPGESQSQAESLKYWLEMFAGAAPCLFPAHPLPDKQISKIKAIDVVLKFQDLSGFCASNNVTPVSLVLAIWTLTLWHHVGQEDLLFEYLDRYGDRQLLRFIVNRHSNLLSVVKDVQLSLVRDANYRPNSVSQVIRQLRLDGQRRFNTIVDFSAHETNNYEQIPTDSVVGLQFLEENTLPQIRILYSCDSLSVEQATLLSRLVARVAEEILQNPDTSLSSLNLIKEEDLKLFWDFAEPMAVHSTVQQLIEAQVTASPDSPAVFSTSFGLSYQQLQNHANHIARLLASMHLGQGDFVPFCMEKYVWAIVAMIGVLKSGAAFVPLDPAYPPDRMKDILKKTNAKTVLTSEVTARIIMQLDCVNAIIINESSIGLRSAVEQPVLLPVDPTSIAYVLFTSGSTGKPKGVVVPHKTICSSMQAHADAMKIGAQTRALQFAAFTFDASICEVLTTLSRGGCVCVPSEDEKLNDVAKFIEASKVNWAFFTPSVLRLMDPSSIPSLKYLVIGGEALDRNLIKIWFGQVERIWNGYGPTETCVFCVTTEIESPEQSPSIIGRTIGSNGYVVDSKDSNKLLPVGCVGELVIEGPLVTSGYLNDDVQTRNNYISDPNWARSLSAKPRCMYKTGDLVRQAPNGNFTYLGRKDAQVKINGQRMELGEVEQTIVAYDKIAHGVAVVPSAGPWNKRLCAVVSPTKQAGLSETSPSTYSVGPFEAFVIKSTPKLGALVRTLRESLAKTLPSYMIPSSWLVVKHIPLIASGKVNRRLIVDCLESLDGSVVEQICYTEPIDEEPAPITTTSIERRIRSIWSRVLNVHESKDIEDFVTLGSMPGFSSWNYPTWVKQEHSYAQQQLAPQKVLPHRIRAANYD
ncbi:MAG: hypothetical protein Q9195_004495 [Heterodermia aff. obscurata]